MTLALFDLDNTLLSGDSDYGWGCFLVEKQVVDREYYEAANRRFFEQYKAGELDIHAYCAFAFKPLSELPMDRLQELHREFMQEVVRPMITAKALELVQHHRDQGHTLAVITATNSFITRPIVKAFGIKHLLATEPRIEHGRYTTEIEGIPCFQQGKVERLKQWLARHDETLAGSYFYTDSVNDLPLLERVEHAVAVDPDPELATIARQRGWKIISLRP